MIFLDKKHFETSAALLPISIPNRRNSAVPYSPSRYADLQYKSNIFAEKVGIREKFGRSKEIFSHPIVRARLANAVKGGAVPRLSTDEPTDIDIFPKQVEGQASGETAQTG